MRNRQLVSRIFLLGILAGPLSAQSGTSLDSTLQASTDIPLTLTPSNWDRYISVETWGLPWRYHAGDDPAWSGRNIDDRSWRNLHPNLASRHFPIDEWTGVGWFRLHVWIEKPTDHLTLGLRGGNAGSIAVYWNGNHIADSLHYRLPISIVVDRPGEQILAVRLEVEKDEALASSSPSGGFFIWIEDFYGTIGMQMRQRSEQMFFTAFLLAFAILHLMLYLYSRSLGGNFYFAVFLTLTATAVFVDIEQVYLASSAASARVLLLLHRALIPLTSLLFLRFLYTLFYPQLPRQFWLFAGLMLIIGIIIHRSPVDDYDYYVYGSTLITFEMIRVLVVAARDKKPGAWTVAVGFILVGLFGVYDAILDLRLMEPIAHVTNTYYFGFFGMMIAMSIHLARDFAGTNRKLLEQMKRTQDEELARRLAEADNARKSRELDDARQLQLSMLPACANDIPGIDICFSMRTATEVGGDYYDYRSEDDGSIIIAIGDATGHGMKAGTMVSIVKGLFITQRSFDNLPFFLQTCSTTIRQMKLGNLFMGLSLVRIKDRTMTVATAGMPPVLIHRKSTGSVEDILIKSMPLGGPHTGDHKERSVHLEEGDTILLMSDGLTELFDAQREMLDYDRVREMLARSSDGTASEIVNALEVQARTWRGEREQSDDITLVVVKMIDTKTGPI